MGAPQYKNRQATPGVFGALKDAIQSAITASAPRSIVQRPLKLQNDEADAMGDRRGRQHNSDNE